MTDKFLDDWVIPYRIPKIGLTDNDSEFVRKLFALICVNLGVKPLTTLAYRPETNGQAWRFNHKIVTRLRHNVARYQQNWDAFVQPLT